jgi:hypothetical protein
MQTFPGFIIKISLEIKYIGKVQSVFLMLEIEVYMRF